MQKNNSISIPVILKIGNGVLDYIGDCLAEENISNVVIWFGNGLIDLFGTRVMDSMKKAGVNVLEYQELDTVAIEDIVPLAFSLSNQTKAIVSIGGGKVIDAGKYAAFLKGLPFISVPTSSSSDGFSSSSASRNAIMSSAISS